MTRKWDPNIEQYRDSGKFGGNDNAAAAGGMTALSQTTAPHIEATHTVRAHGKVVASRLALEEAWRVAGEQSRIQGPGAVEIHAVPAAVTPQSYIDHGYLGPTSGDPEDTLLNLFDEENKVDLRMYSSEMQRILLGQAKVDDDDGRPWDVTQRGADMIFERREDGYTFVVPRQNFEDLTDEAAQLEGPHRAIPAVTLAGIQTTAQAEALIDPLKDAFEARIKKLMDSGAEVDAMSVVDTTDFLLRVREDYAPGQLAAELPFYNPKHDPARYPDIDDPEEFKCYDLMRSMHYVNRATNVVSAKTDQQALRELNGR